MAINVNDFLSNLGTYVASSGVGSVGAGGNIKYHYLPGEPRNCLAIILHGGPGLPGEPAKRRAFQVLVRNTDAGTAGTIATTVHALFDDVVADLDNCLMGGDTGRFEPHHLPGPHGVDENGDFWYSLNFDFVTPD